MKNDAKTKYRPFTPVPITDRRWPGRTITEPPVWCSVDLRDGNQALITPMMLGEKLRLFKALCDIGIKEIEVGFPSSNDTEFETLRALIDNNLIPDNVTIQVLVQAREHLIRKTFEAIKGAKNVILHFYNSTSELQRRVVFGTDRKGVTDIAVNAAKLIKELSKEVQDGTNLIYEYSPESFSATECDFAVEICDEVLCCLGATKEKKVILNLPSTVECSTPNGFADQVEYFCTHLKGRENAVISVHPHNDRGTAVASAELALLAGAERIEGTLFGNGERTGNVDIVTLALNMYSQGVDPKLALDNINEIKSLCEDVTGMPVPDRHPYAGKLVFTAFSGSHQDAINKGIAHMKKSGSALWEVPYLPIDPADIGREYEPIIRINSQSGKGGAAFIMANDFGYYLPKAMQPEFGEMVKNECVKKERELTNEEIFKLFEHNYIDIKQHYRLLSHKFREESAKYSGSTVTFEGIVECGDKEYPVTGRGNGPIDSFFNALGTIGVTGYKFASYHEHAVSEGSDSKAIAYIELVCPKGKTVFGVGISHNINLASIRGVLCAINRSIILNAAEEKNDEK